MANPPGVPSALGIDAVEWLSEGGQGLIVRVTGHWRRRRPPLRRRPQLVIDSQGQRLRFPALPEPPALTGAPAGTWQMSFSVPTSAAPHLGGRMWLQVGGVSVPLPLPEAATGGEMTEEAELAELAETTEPADPETIARREVRSAELAAQTARQRLEQAEAAAAELAATIGRLESELERVRSEPARLETLLAQRERERRSAEQRVHAEYALRIELEEELAERQRGGNRAEAQMQLAVREERIRELEGELEALRRRADEAEQVEAATRASRGAGDPRGRTAPQERLREELAVALAALRPAVQASGGPGTAAAAGSPGAPEPLGLRGELELVARRASTRLVDERQPIEPMLEETIVSLRQELEARTAVEAHLRTLLAAHESRAAPAPDEDRELRSTLAELARELAGLRAVVAEERAGRLQAQARVAELERELREQQARAARVYHAVEALRDDLEAVRSGRPPRIRGASGPLPVERPAAGPVEPERLAAALTRLREATPPPRDAEPDEPPGGLTEPASPASAWLASAFKTLAARDPAGAGRLLLALLPAQPVVHPDRVRYDLVLTERSCVQVTSAGGTAQVFFVDSPRAQEEVDFQVFGELSAIARTVGAGPVRRRLGRGLAHVRGERSKFAALEALVRARLRLRELHAAGVRLDPQLALLLASVMIDRRWTAGEQFTIAYQARGSQAPSGYLEVRDGRPVAVTEGTHPGPVASTISCPAEALPALLAGQLAGEVCVQGEERPIRLLAQWLERAQSG